MVKTNKHAVVPRIVYFVTLGNSRCDSSDFLPAVEAEALRADRVRLRYILEQRAIVFENLIQLPSSEPVATDANQLEGQDSVSDDEYIKTSPIINRALDANSEFHKTATSVKAPARVDTSSAPFNNAPGTSSLENTNSKEPVCPFTDEPIADAQIRQAIPGESRSDLSKDTPVQMLCSHGTSDMAVQDDHPPLVSALPSRRPRRFAALQALEGFKSLPARSDTVATQVGCVEGSCVERDLNPIVDTAHI